MAVVHPVLFLKYKALRYRMICSALVWLTVLVFSLICALLTESLVYVASANSVLLFCFSAVLKALKQPQPGDGGRERERANQAKMRAFKIILVLLTSTTVQYVPLLLVWLLQMCLPESKSFILAQEVTTCIMVSVVQPLLFLPRTGKLSCMGTP